MTDGTKTKLKLPPWHIPYLEKHNIYKLFSELARELVIQQPDDHVFFIKYLLTSAVKNLHIPHVILLCSPKINVNEIGKQIAAQTDQYIVTEELLLDVLKKTRKHCKAAEIVLGIQSLFNNNSDQIMKSGWILVGCVRSKKEALQLIDVGILPTHVLYLISPYNPKLTDFVYCNVPVYWPDYRRDVYGIREVFKKKLIEVHLNELIIDSVVSKCVELIKIETIESGPKQPRVLLLGPRGCGRKTQAKMLETKFNLIHIDFEYILCQTWISDTELGQKLKECGDRACFHPELLSKLLNKRLLDEDCLEHGWVLTGYPFNVVDFKYIDCLETPPNRVIFLECDLNICYDRLTNRRVNVYTGSTTKLDSEVLDGITKKRLKMHPKDQSDLINAELQYYCTQYGTLKKYCGGTGNVVNADQSICWVHENIMAVIMRDLPVCSPRDPFEEGHTDGNLAMAYKYFEPDHCLPCPPCPK